MKTRKILVTQEIISERFDRYLIMLNEISKNRIEENRDFIEGIYHTLVDELENTSKENYEKGLEIENKIRELFGGSLDNIQSKKSENEYYLPKPIGSWEKRGAIERIL